MLDPLARSILDVWFGTTDEERAAAPARWFSPDPAFDDDLRERFGPFVAPAAAGAFAGWESTPLGALSLVLLLDQIPRNIYRDDARSFAYDAAAREVLKRALGQGHDAWLSTQERTFLYMPLMHSEQLSDHGLAARCFERAVLLASTPDEAAQARGTLLYERKHVEILHRFGRYPHRNQVLGRQSTPEELDFLQHGRGF
ncbi:MAG: DUF924 domain-containing protein [Deltaproteobacteria bacterium]|nr:MAG: DUF924 domain-containing protein [Deltaproteobacteria bacterium]